MSEKMDVTVRLTNFILVLFFALQSESILLKNDEGINLTLLEQKLTALETSVESLKSQCACGKSSPAFMALLTTRLSHCTNHQAIIFDNVKLNIGAGYNSKHGIFRAPVAGVYAFSTTISTAQHYNAYYVAIVRGNVTNEIGYLYSEIATDNIWSIRSTAVVTHLYKDEEVWMTCLKDSTLRGDHTGTPELQGAQDYHSHFSGFLVSKH